MDTTERARLRALCEAAPGGEVRPCCAHARADGHNSWWSVRDARGEAVMSTRRSVAVADLYVAARDALPALLDDLDAADVRASVAERERDVAVARLSRIEAIRDEARATLGAGDGVCYEGLTDAARRVVRERDEAVAMLREILARVHRDGGQHVDAVGLAQATREADEVIVRDRAERDEARAEVERLRAHLCTVLGWVYDACDQTVQCPQCNAVWWDQPEGIDENWHLPGCEIFAAEVASGRSVDVRRSPACDEKLRAVVAEEMAYADRLRREHAEEVANSALREGLAEVERLRAELASAQRHTDAAVDGIRAMLPAALTVAREEEREACAALCDAHGDTAERERDACCDDRSRSLHAGRMHGADECARAIRARSEGGAR